MSDQEAFSLIGKTRSTFEKLMKSDVPVFYESANIEPLIELREELRT